LEGASGDPILADAHSRHRSQQDGQEQEGCAS
jgi:hypothetical protein